MIIKYVNSLFKVSLVVYLMNVLDSRAQAAVTNPNSTIGDINYKYVLRWAEKTLAPFNFLGEGNAAFVKNNCKYTNCFVTDDASLINITEFDAILFNGRKVVDIQLSDLPQVRSQKQKYIFVATESADRFPVCNEALDNFFNWTWTYKLSSDFRFGYITTYDLEGNEVGPALDMKWLENMEPISEELKTELSSKSKAAASFISNCKTNSQREDFIKQVNVELKKLGWNVDRFGRCGTLVCPRTQVRVCNKKLKEDYFFYLSFENSFAEDYVTEKVLLALNNNAVPVVFGSANYSRFLPPGSYLDARKLGPKNLARVMNEVINNKDRYHDYFRWRNHFTYKQTLTNADICKLCEVLNDDQKVKTVSTWIKFRQWWNTKKCA